MEVRQKWNTFLVCVMFAVIGTGMPIMSLLFPGEAERKGATISQFGSVFGAQYIASMMIAPIFGRYGSKIGIKLLFICGGAVRGACMLSLGALLYVTDTQVFIGLAFALRFLWGVGEAAILSSMTACLMALLPKMASSIAAIHGVCLSLGYIAGSPLVSVIYSVGGYSVPFYVSGSANLLMTLVLFGTIHQVIGINANDATPKIENEDVEDKLTSEGKNNTESCKENAILSYRDILTQAGFIAPLINITAGKAAGSLITSMLENHMTHSEANATQAHVATVISLYAAFMLIGNAIAGYTSDKLKIPTAISYIGYIILITSFSVLGPLPFLPLAPSVPLIICGIIPISLGASTMVVSSYGRLIQTAVALGFPKTDHTNMMVAGLFSFSFQLGGVLGSTLSGITIDAIGFRPMTMWLQVLLLTFFLGDVIQNVCCRTRQI